MYEPRFYRKEMGNKRLKSFVAKVEESDLWIAVDNLSYTHEIENFATKTISELRKQIFDYAKRQPEFLKSFEPIDLLPDAPEIVRKMSEATKVAGIGPMGAVAGAFSEFVAKAIKKQFLCNEIIIENGGDIYLDLQQGTNISMYAGNSPLSDKFVLKIPAEKMPIGVCASAGTVGHSTSFGKADCVMVASSNTLLADAFATAIGNRIKAAKDIQAQLNLFDDFADIQSIVIIIGENIGVKGDFEIDLKKD